MKKIILVVFLLIVIIILAKDKSYVIPKESIRFRVIANSNSINDQLMKEKVKTETEKILYEIIKDTNSLEESRRTIIGKIPTINKVVDDTLEENKYKYDFTVKYGYNYFPKKEYKGVVYEDGEYESLVITLGDGAGDNWWCVLFPPICFIETSDKEDIEYRFVIEDLFNKYLNK